MSPRTRTAAALLPLLVPGLAGLALASGAGPAGAVTPRLAAEACLPVPGLPCLPDVLTADPPVTVEGTPAVGSPLTATEPGWTVPATTTYQWRRDGEPISGATGRDYTPVAADLDTEVSVVATGTALLLSGTSTSAPVLVAQGAAPAATTRPVVSATGALLTASAGTWAVGSTPVPGDDLAFSYQWHRSGTGPIRGATQRTYRSTGQDAGRRLSVVVTAALPGHAPGRAGSAAVQLGKVPTRLRLDVERPRVRAGERAPVRVSLRGRPGVPTGRVVVRSGSRTLLTLTFTPADDGLVVGRLPALEPGTHRISATYRGSVSHGASSSGLVTLRVTAR